MESSRRIGIIGAGAWGLSLAWSLLRSGLDTVRVFERAEAGSGSTALAAGLVSTHLRQVEDIRTVLRTREHLRSLRDWGLGQGLPSAEHVYHAAGSITLVPHDEADKLERLQQRIRIVGGEAERMDPAEIGRRWPLTDLDGMTGLHSAPDGYVEAGDLIDLLQARVRSLGGRIESQRAARLHRDGPTAVAVEAGGQRVRLDDVVVAAGAWTKTILREAGIVIPLKAYRTQLAQLAYPHAGRFPVLHDSLLRVYARPDGPQSILMGDGTEFVESEPDEFDRAADQPFIQKIAESASTRLVAGGAAELRRGWAGLCVCTPDRDPLIGPYPGIPGLHVMAGDNGFGVMRSLALGEFAAHRLLEHGGSDAYLPARFAPGLDFEIREGFEL